MMIFSSSKVFFVLIVSFCVVEGTLSPDGTVSVDCGTTKGFICNATGVPIGWNIAGLSGINIPGPFLARNAAMGNSRISSTDSGSSSQVGVSQIEISGFSLSDNGGTIQCVNETDNSTIGMATISVVPLPLPPPTNVTATVESCDSITLQWTQPSEPEDITSVSCTPPSPGCTACKTSPCTITGLNPSTEYEFTVTLTSGGCKVNMSTTTARTRKLNAPTNLRAAVEACDSISLQWDQPSEPADITTSVSCTPPSPGCAECTTSPCTITGLNPSTEYQFTVTLNSGGCRTSMNMTLALIKNTSSCVASNDTGNVNLAPLAALVLLLLPIPLIYALGVLIAQLLFFKDKTYCEVFWCCFLWRKDKSYESNSTELREHREEAAYQTVPKKEEILTNGYEIKDPKKSKQEVVTDEAFKKQETKDGDVITDETVQQQGTPDGHHKQKRSRKHKEEVQHQNLDVAKNQIQYADLDFSDHQSGRNVIIPLVDPVTYADV